jgi:hypothetical protein
VAVTRHKGWTIAKLSCSLSSVVACDGVRESGHTANSFRAPEGTCIADVNSMPPPSLKGKRASMCASIIRKVYFELKAKRARVRASLVFATYAYANSTNAGMAGYTDLKRV